MFADTNWKAASAELMGTFFLVFFGYISFTNLRTTDMLFEGALTLGLTLMVLVHILGPVSGCHLNPIITIPIWLSGKISSDDSIAYIVAQTTGASLGFIIFKLISPEYSESTGEWYFSDNSMFEGNIALMITAMIGTAFFVSSLLTSQDPMSIGATVFVVSMTAFYEVNPGVNLGEVIGNGEDLVVFGIIGSFIGCFLGWAIKENIIDP